MSTSTYPVRVDVSPELGLNRWLWLVKWILVIPHYVVLAFLWVAFVVLSIAAFFAIVFTGRYPRQLFEFNVGVLRWTWRVVYYSYGALATDRYPPFTLADVPDYPAHLEIAYPEHLSRGLVLVKWWLLALPHYAVVGIFAGGGVYAVNSATAAQHGSWLSGGGLIGLLVLVAAVVLLFTGRYPRSILDLVLGMNRWVLRVAAYAALMTDAYPPFRLDMGPQDPGSHIAIAPGTPSIPPVADESGAPGPQDGPLLVSDPQDRRPASTSSQHWSAGRLVTMVVGCLMVVVAGGLMAGGATLAVAQGTLEHDGFFMSSEEQLQTSTRAIISPNLETRIADGAAFLPERLLGRTRLVVTRLDAGAVFAGIAPTADVDSYLAGVGHTMVTDVDTSGAGDGPVYADVAGGAPRVAPGDALQWSAASSGKGTQDLTWSLEDGDWTLVVMNVDGSPDVAVDVSVGAEFPALGWTLVGMLAIGGLLLLLAIVLIRRAMRLPEDLLD